MLLLCLCILFICFFANKKNSFLSLSIDANCPFIFKLNLIELKFLFLFLFFLVSLVTSICFEDDDDDLIN